MRLRDGDRLEKPGRAPGDRPRLQAGRRHQGPGHWHVDIRRDVIVCRACEARIPKYLNPDCCPECGDGAGRLLGH